MPVILGILSAVPALVKAVESIFPGAGKGLEKKDWVIQAAGVLYDKSLGRAGIDIPYVNERRLFLAYVSATIEEVLISIKEGKSE